MRKLLAVAMVAVMAACGGETTAPTAANGTLFFKIDALTCSGTSVVSFAVDGSVVGSETISAGGTSKGYTVTAGSHVVGARVSNGNYVWPNTNINVPANGTFTQVLPCG
jgi:hypothetical protein